MKKKTTNNKSAPGKITYKHDFLLFESAKTVLAGDDLISGIGKFRKQKMLFCLLILIYVMYLLFKDKRESWLTKGAGSENHGVQKQNNIKRVLFCFYSKL